MRWETTYSLTCESLGSIRACFIGDLLGLGPVGDEVDHDMSTLCRKLFADDSS